MDLNISDITVVQLKRWLEVLKLSTKGTKNELFARLAKVPVEVRGSAPENCTEMDQQILQPDVESRELDMESGEEMQIEVQTLENLRVEIAKAQKKLENLNRQIGNEDTENEGGENAQLTNRDGNSSSENLEQSVRSFENTQRGDDRDGEIGGGRSGGSGDDRDGEIGGGRSGGSGDDRDGEIGGGRSGGSGEDRDGDMGGGRGEGRDGDRNGDRREERDGDRSGVRGNSGEIGVQQNGGRFETSGLLSPGFNMAREILMDFTEKVSVRSWIAQYENISALYSLSDMQRRALLISKLKGNSLEWMHADAGRFAKPVNELLEQLKLAFGGIESKSVLRRKFEARSWSPNEQFATYFGEKCRLARDVAMDEDELLDGLVEGIPVLSLRTQAKLQCFDGPERMLRAFADIRLPARGPAMAKLAAAKAVPASSETRCFNCNAKGHWKRECTKPKRSPGSCYGCGAEDHRIAECPGNKKKAENNYSAK
ncbi:uncharacterized protein [Drosophila kikkawai]|uniref:Uncharacterized protein n=1 Tax=Drosophila kikkawai TaxID=30033 RepID=A0ABM3C8K6_DROKI|nr:uncharacterized protein LOC121503265 [Drosophila kikkawai]